MIKRILNEARKSLIMGIAFAVGAISTTAIAITVSTTFNSGDTLTASALNELKEVLVKLPNFTTDASGNALLASGNVGIGTADPTQKLEVEGTIKATSFIGDGSALTGISGSSIWTSDATGNALLASHSVGIGTTTPTAKLDIDGTMAFSNIITLSGTTPNVSGSNVFKVTSPVTITDFLGGVPGQEITIIISTTADANIEFSHTSGQLNLEGQSKFTLTPASCVNIGGTLKLIYDGTSWHEISRSNNPTTAGCQDA